MDYIKQFIGLKVKQRMKMEHRNKKDGLLIKNMLVIGIKTKNVGLVYNIMEMVINMKVDGLIIKEMDKVHIGLVKERISINI